MFLLFLFGRIVYGQEQTSTLKAGADFVNCYVWRGLLYDGSPNIQPGITYTNASGKFVIGSWGSFSFTSPYKETDFYASYTIGKISFSLWDYFAIPAVGKVNYLHFSHSNTYHAIEASAVYNGSGAFPLRLTAGTFVYGNDRDPSTLKNYYSTYLEAAYPVSFHKQQVLFFIGGTPSKGLYASNAAISNIGLSVSSKILITDHFTIPVTGMLSVNPESEHIFLVLTFNISSND